MRKIFGLVIIAVLSLIVVGCGVGDKTYSSKGFKITMADGLYEKDLVSATVYYEGEEAIVSALKEEFTLVEIIGLSKESSLDEYVEAIMTNNQADYTVKTDGDMRYFTYENTVSGKKYFYFSAVYKSDDAFWLVNFASDINNKSKYEPLFLKWAKTVEFE